MKRWSADIQLINSHKEIKRKKKEESKMKTYTSDANTVLKFHLIDNDKLSNSDALSTFRPLYTHQIFTSAERIFGYTGLKVDVYLSCATLKGFLKVRYNKKLAKADDVQKKLWNHFGENFTVEPSTFQSWVKYDLDKFRPPGKKVSQFDRICDKHRHYEIFKVGLTDKRFSSKINRSWQALLFFYIESASFIEKDSSWNYFMMYEVVKKFKNNPPSYRLIGFWTTYEQSEGKNASNRISQFMILPAYQKQGFGKALVEGIYRHYINDKTWKEISVEKPTKAFEKLWESVKASLVVDDSKAKRGGCAVEAKKATKK